MLTFYKLYKKKEKEFMFPIRYFIVDSRTGGKKRDIVFCPNAEENLTLKLRASQIRHRRSYLSYNVKKHE